MLGDLRGASRRRGSPALGPWCHLRWADRARVGAGLTKLWLGVHVMRELNLDADRLSHPSLFGEVLRDAQRAQAHKDTHPLIIAALWRGLARVGRR